MLEAMDAQGVTRAELARLVGVSDAAITQLFRQSTKQSRLVPAINRVLGLPPPTQHLGIVDALRAELEQLWPGLSVSDRELLIETARRLATKR